MAGSESADRLIQASPTKAFFISMLTKDVPLIPAIIDLVDNSLDGARSLRPKDDYKGLSVNIKATPSLFEITDNCGGIDVDTARTYAFRFGRPGEMKQTKHSVGQFGVGMKRALFKLGTKFRVRSTTKTSRFSVTVDVPKWQADPDPNWTFKFDSPPETGLQVKPADVGTSVTVLVLHDEIAEQFKTERFQDELRNELALRHSPNLANGLKIVVNDIALKSVPAELLRSTQLKPVSRALSLTSKKKDDVAIQLYAGIAPSSPEEAGWYVYCNDRLVLGPDTSAVTGWGVTWESDKIPKYHNQFAPFRGYIFFDADDASALPWNTTKTGVDAEHPVYRRARLEMIQAMRPVIDFCNELKEEKKADEESGPLQRVLDQAKPIAIDKIAHSATFRYPSVARQPTPPDQVNIEYRRPKKQVARVKRALKTQSNSEVGRRTFDYYLTNVLDEEE